MKSLACILTLAASASAHTIFQQIYVNGVTQGRYVGFHLPSYDGPITDVTSTYMACNGGPNPLNTNSNYVYTVPAGATVQGFWSQTLTSVNTDVIDPSHKGPIQVYMAPTSDASSGVFPANGWFKIYEDGLHADGTWAVDTLIANNGLWSFTIPSDIKPGNYYLRGELIALHAASSYPGAQIYMECAQINVTGGGSASPATVSFPGAYKSTDPGITFNLYAGSKTYVIPGPAVYVSGGGGGGAAPPTTTVAPTTTTSKPVTTTSPSQTASTTSKPPVTTTSSASGATQTKYGQCGGAGWAGPTVCAAGSTCTASGAYYSQCL